ncbi:hypothetical protein NHH88_07255 [Oxalobacteraceae bacterium OTU3CAMAD1]|nr:hypothetical protein NHH88_07255 [Oxalobacteraceae bacterium OTU3CAMAD1]
MMIAKYPPLTGWGENEVGDAASDAQNKLKQARLNTTPEYQKHLEDQTWLRHLLLDLLYDEHVAFAIPAPRTPIVTHRTTSTERNSSKPLAYDSDGHETSAYTSFQLDRRAFSIALMRFIDTVRTSQSGMRRYDQTAAKALLGAHAIDVLRQGFKRAEVPHDVGSSLYLYQQMYDRKLCAAPALSRAAWLLKNAPLRKPISEKLIPRSKWQRIQEQWKDHFSSSHYWAAVAATIKSPLRFNEDLLFDFVCNVDVDQFKRLADTFFDFRVRVVPPKVSAMPMYLKQGLSWREIDQANLLLPTEVPNALEPYQWDALALYPTKASSRG